MKLLDFLRTIALFLQFRLWRKIQLRKPYPAENCIFLDLNENAIHRYLTTLIQLLNRPDYQQSHTIIIPLDINILSEFHKGRNWKKYETMAVEHEQLRFAPRLKRFPWKRTSIDYFSPNKEEGHYTIPIGSHPLFTRIQPASDIRYKKVAIASAIDPLYNRFDTTLWSMPNRNQCFGFLKEHFPEVISDHLGAHEYSQLLASSSFFICLPGYIMPLCHNFYEALISLCIPIVHINYLVHLPAKLARILTSVTWREFSDLRELLSSIENGEFSEQDINRLRQKIDEYVKHEYKPSKIFQSMKKAEIIYLCAEEKSVNTLTQK